MRSEPHRASKLAAELDHGSHTLACSLSGGELLPRARPGERLETISEAASEVRVIWSAKPGTFREAWISLLCSEGESHQVYRFHSMPPTLHKELAELLGRYLPGSGDIAEKFAYILDYYNSVRPLGERYLPERISPHLQSARSVNGWLIETTWQHLDFSKAMRGEFEQVLTVSRGAGIANSDNVRIHFRGAHDLSSAEVSVEIGGQRTSLKHTKRGNLGRSELRGIIDEVIGSVTGQEIASFAAVVRSARSFCADRFYLVEECLESDRRRNPVVLDSGASVRLEVGLAQSILRIYPHGNDVRTCIECAIDMRECTHATLENVYRLLQRDCDDSPVMARRAVLSIVADPATAAHFDVEPYPAPFVRAFLRSLPTGLPNDVSSKALYLSGGSRLQSGIVSELEIVSRAVNGFEGVSIDFVSQSEDGSPLPHVLLWADDIGARLQVALHFKTGGVIHLEELMSEGPIRDVGCSARIDFVRSLIGIVGCGPQESPPVNLKYAKVRLANVEQIPEIWRKWVSGH